MEQQSISVSKAGIVTSLQVKKERALLALGHVRLALVLFSPSLCRRVVPLLSTNNILLRTCALLSLPRPVAR